MTDETRDPDGLPAECQNCGYVVLHSSELDLCPECGAGHWRMPPTHPIPTEIARKLTEDGTCPSCGTEDCCFDGWEPVVAVRLDADGNEVQVEPPEKVKALLATRGLLPPQFAAGKPEDG